VTPSGPGVAILSGPTGSGKSELALELAERFGAEIVGADSRQIYRDMPLGTAAPRADQLARVPHHLVGFLDPYERYSAARFSAEALAAIEALAARGRRALVVGGTGFYLRALCGDVRLSAAYDPALRARLAREAAVHPPEVLHAWLAVRAPARAARVLPGDRYRVARALEIALAPEARDARAPEPRSLRSAGIPFVKLYLEREADERIGPAAAAADAVGYRQALAYLAGFSTFAELRAGLVRATRRYAKRQATWWRSEPNVRWLAARGAFEEASRALEERLGWVAAGCTRGRPEGD
jgi:tRNA dimethylallyltransferase